MANTPEIKAFNVIKGFLNLSLDSAFWAARFREVAANDTFGQAAPTGRTVMIEYSSPNTNKPLHLGHIRNNLLGYSVAQILKANGNKVIKVNLVNDRGIHICKSMLAWKLYGGGETPASSGMKGDHLVGKYYVEFDKHYKAQIKELVAAGQSEEEAKKNAPIMRQAQEWLRRWEAKDPEIYSLWETMNGWVYEGFDVTYKALASISTRSITNRKPTCWARAWWKRDSPGVSSSARRTVLSGSTSRPTDSTRSYCCAATAHRSI